MRDPASLWFFLAGLALAGMIGFAIGLNVAGVESPDIGPSAIFRNYFVGAGVVGGAVLVYLTWRRTRALEVQVEHQAEDNRNRDRADRQRQNNETFALAVQQTAHENLEVRIGGISTLAQLGRDDDDQYARVVDVLGGLIRRLAPRSYTDQDEGDPKELVDETVEAALKALRSMTRPEGADKVGIDLSGTDLRRANMIAADLRNAELSGALLSGAGLAWADLRRANMSITVLNEAHLGYARLSGAVLYGAAFRSANLERAELREVAADNTDFSDANLSHADFSGSSLPVSILKNSSFETAVSADVEYIDLHGNPIERR